MAEQPSNPSKTSTFLRGIMAPEFLALAILATAWWAAQLSLAGYFVYRVYHFFA